MQPIVNHFIEGHRFAPRPFNRAGGSFGASYYARPWVLLRDCWCWLRAFVHRGLYGFDGSDTWSLDHTLAQLLPRMLRHLNAHKQGVPPAFFGYTADDWARDPFGQDADLAAAQARYTAWIEDSASACEEYVCLMEQGCYHELYPPDYWTRDVRAEIAAAGDLAAWFDAPSPLDRYTEEELAASRARFDQELAAIKQRMASLFTHFETLWD